MKTLIIKSNHGNHTGFNRTWSIENKCDSIEEAKIKLSEIADKIADDYGMTEKDRIDLYNGKNEALSHGLTYYSIITEEDYEWGIFDGGHMGYASQEIIDYFNN